ncbi:MAG: hypothetical protein GY722_14195, partial [bacterium]|nr:hypothetical protein [bacterium]
LGDGHTYIDKLPNASGELPNHFLPVRFATSSDGLFISDTTPSFEELRGASIEAVAGLSVTELSLRTHIRFPCENQLARLRILATSLGSMRQAREFIPDLGDSLRLQVRIADAVSTRDLVLAYGLTLEERRAGPWSLGDLPRIAPVKGPFGHSMLDQDGVGYLRLAAMWSREAFESMNASGRTDIDKWLKHAYERYLGKNPPEDRVEAISEFPSLIEEVDVLLGEMRERGSRDLIVDLRGNGGGFSIIAEPLLYQFHGDSYLEEPNPVYFATRVSTELLEIQGRSLAELSDSHGREFRLGEIVFDPSRSEVRPSLTREQFIDRFRERGITRLDLLEDSIDGHLRVVAIADAATFSAAFELTYQLHRMGAALVGVPPSQSPRAFTDSTPYQLTNSGLRGAMARSAVVYPGIPSEAGAIVMDLPMTWERLRTYDFHPDAALHTALELLRSGSE